MGGMAILSDMFLFGNLLFLFIFSGLLRKRRRPVFEVAFNN
jgi:hypothetical protein